MKQKIILIALLVLPLFNCFADKQDDAYYKDFVEFQKVSGSEKSQKLMLKTMFEQLKKASGETSDMFSNMEKMMEEELAVLNKKVYPIYKKHITHKDLKAIIKFYKSPAGKSFVKSQPAILKESMKIGAEWGQGIAQRVMKKMKK